MKTEPDWDLARWYGVEDSSHHPLLNLHLAGQVGLREEGGGGFRVKFLVRRQSTSFRERRKKFTKHYKFCNTL
jgi:hypothetical protein